MPITVETNEGIETEAPDATEEVVEQKPEVEEEDQSEAAENADETSEEEELESEADKESDTEDEDDDDDDEEREDNEKPKRKNGFKKRVDRLNRQKRVLSDENERLRLELERLRSVKPNKEDDELGAKPQAKSNDGKPNVDDFESYDDYVEELAAWRYKQEKIADQKRYEELALKKEQEEIQSNFRKKVEDFASTVDDFEEVLSDVDDIVANPGLGDLIMTSDYSAQVMYELAKNPEEFRRVNSLSYVGAAKAIARIEARLEQSSSKESEAKKESKTTKAPPPLKKVGSKGKGVPKRLDDPDLSQKEFERLRAEQLKKLNAY